MGFTLRTAMLAALVAAAPVSVATAATTVKVALFDMTAVADGMTGELSGRFGMMGRGGFGQGVGQGAGRGFGGMMGGGMMGGGFGMGPGMTGAGMMSIRTDMASAAAGEVTFEVTNWSRSILHEMVVVAVDNADAPLPYDYETQQVVEDQIKVLGEAEDLEPNATGSLTLTLEPGAYLLICNIPGHYGAGMQTAFTIEG